MIDAREIGACLGTRTATSTGSADIWFAWVGDHAGDVGRYSRELLSDEEHARLHEYRSPGAAERYVLTRALVRIVLGERLGARPRDVRIARTDTGKPVIAEGLHFNLSHSGDLILLAVSRERAVGVDIERRRGVAKVDKLIARWLTEAERDEVARLTTAGQSVSDAFLRVWSLKEAALKALGVGISGAAHAAVHTVEAVPLDDLLDALDTPSGEPEYVGALAFA